MRLSLARWREAAELSARTAPCSGLLDEVLRAICVPFCPTRQCAQCAEKMHARVQGAEGRPPALVVRVAEPLFSSAREHRLSNP